MSAHFTYNRAPDQIQVLTIKMQLMVQDSSPTKVQLLTVQVSPTCQRR
jgi:hypothetical protein